MELHALSCLSSSSEAFRDCWWSGIRSTAASSQVKSIRHGPYAGRPASLAHSATWAPAQLPALRCPLRWRRVLHHFTPYYRGRLRLKFFCTLSKTAHYPGGLLLLSVWIQVFVLRPLTGHVAFPPFTLVSYSIFFVLPNPFPAAARSALADRVFAPSG